MSDEKVVNLKPLDIQIGGDHYKQLQIQPVEYCYYNSLGALESAVIKYITRHDFKDGKKDLQKAIHCIEMLIDLHYPEEEPEDE